MANTMTDDPLLAPPEAAEFLGGLKLQTLAAWRCTNKGPAYVKIGALVRYPRSALERYLQRQTVTPSDEAE